MCVIIAGETQPDTTKLMNIPVTIEGDKYNFFMYINNFDLQLNSDGNNYKKNNDKFSGRFMDSVNLTNTNFKSYENDSFGNYARFDSSNDFYSNNNSNNSIMVVPFPVIPHTSSSKIGLVEISTDDMKQLITQIKSLKPIPKTFSNSMRGLTLSFNAQSAPLEVHKVGNYNISVATSYDQLLERIDWTKFNKPANFEQRINTFKNPELYPREYAYFYIVASAIENIKDDGFGIVYPQLDNNITYLPTAHEDTEFEHKFDVEMYMFGYNNDKSFYNKEYLHNTLNKLKNQPVKMLNNVYKKMNFDNNISSFSFMEENNVMRNHNIFVKKI
jgi:hypothetical protein